MTTDHPRRRTLATGLALLTAGLTGALVPMTAAQAVAVPQPTQFLVLDSDQDGGSGLYRRIAPAGSLTAIVAESNGIDIESVSSSRDGSRFADTSTSYDGEGNPLRSRVVVRDVSGRTVQKVDDVNADTTAVFGTAISPDGLSVVWSRYSFTTNAFTMHRAAIGGTLSTVASEVLPGTFLNASTVLVLTDTGPATMAPTGGTVTPLNGLPDAADSPVVSPDGSKIAWSLDTTAEGALIGTATIEVAPLSFDGGWNIGTPVTVATGQNNHTPSFVDSSTLAFVRDNGDAGTGATFTTLTNGSTPAGTAQGSDIGDVYGQAMGSADTGITGTAGWMSSILTGTSATVRWTPPADADLSGVLITRSLGGVEGPAVYVPAPLTSRVDTGLAIGSTYSYNIMAVDRSGNVSEPVQRQLTALLAAPSASDPTSTRHAKAPFLVTFGPTSAGGSFTVSYRSNRNPEYTPWINNDVSRASAIFGSAASTGITATTALVGTTYQFRALGEDLFGNATPLVTSAQPVVPFDHTKAGFVGGTTVAHGAAWLGSYRVINSTAHKATLNVTGNRLQIVGWRCPSCGVMEVFEGPRLIAAIDTRSASTQTRVVLYSRTWGVSGSRTITIKPRGTAGRPNVILDGFAIRGAL